MNMSIATNLFAMIRNHLLRKIGMFNFMKKIEKEETRKKLGLKIGDNVVSRSSAYS